jgi:hypothetical protein
MDRHVGRLIDFLSLVSATLVLSPHDRPLNSADASQWLVPAAFDSETPASQLRYGNLPFNAARAFPIHLGSRPAQDVQPSQKQTMTFRVEAFNALT